MQLTRVLCKVKFLILLLFFVLFHFFFVQFGKQRKHKMKTTKLKLYPKNFCMKFWFHLKGNENQN